MNIRETLNKNASLTTVATVAVIVLTLLIIVLEMRPRHVTATAGNSWYCFEDGSKPFKDDAGKIPPFDYGGGKAVRCYMFRCGEGEPFVGYMQKYTDAAKAKLEEFRSTKTMTPEIRAVVANMHCILVKKPGDNKPGDNGWVPRDDPKAAAIANPQPPLGQMGTVEMVPAD